MAYGELGRECATPGSSNSRFAGEEMIDSDVIRLEMTSGEAGWTCTRFPSAARSFNDGGGRDPLRPSYFPSYLVRSGMGGGVEGGAILASWWCWVVRLASTVSLCSRCNLSWSVHCICSLQCRVLVRTLCTVPGQIRAQVRSRSKESSKRPSALCVKFRSGNKATTARDSPYCLDSLVSFDFRRRFCGMTRREGEG